MPKRHYTIYCDESAKKGPHFSNFYGGALIRSADREAIEGLLNSRKDELNLYKELKWTYVTEPYLGKYQEFINLYLDLIASGRIKLRVMFTHNLFKIGNLTEEQVENQYFILYYQFIKHAFGLSHANPSTIDRISIALLLDQVPNTAEKFEAFRIFLARLSNTNLFREARVTIAKNEIADVDSKRHVILQGLDIILGATQFKLNDFHKEKPRGARRRGKRTIAKLKLYQLINRRVRSIYPHFNIGASTGINALTDRWDHPYRHWKFQARDAERDETFQTKE